MTDAPQPTPPPPSRKAWWQHALTGARRLLAVIAIGVVVVAVARSYVFDDARVCREMVASDTGMVKVCGPVGLEDVPALGVLLLVGMLLLLNDMSEVSIPGLVTLKRAVQEQAKQTEALTREVANIALNMRQETNVNVYPRPLDDAIKDVDERDKVVQEKGRGAVAGTTAAYGPDETGVSAPSEERALLETEVTRLWNALVPLIPDRRRVDIYPFGPVSLDWFGLYRRDIEAFRTLRNTVVHEPGNLTDDDVRKGVALGRRLLASYRKFVAAIAAP